MEQEILQLLGQSPGQGFSLKEISKQLDRQQFREDPTWARGLVNSLLNRNLIQKDRDGRYFLPSAESPV